MLTILRLPQVIKRTGLGRSTIYQLVKDGKFSPPIALSVRAVGWLESDVNAFLQSRVDAARLALDRGI